ncbi:MAG: hypothetical protein QM723_08890 [Myxococcaceae bacterium]
MPAESSSIALLLPPPERLEGEVAAALRSRGYDDGLLHWWAERALEIGTGEVDDQLLDELATAWSRYTREVADELIVSAEKETRRLSATLSTFPESERAMAWTRERALLGGRVGHLKAEQAYRSRLLGDGYDADPSWLVKLQTIEVRGDKLRAACLRHRWESLNRLPPGPRNLTCEAEIARHLSSDEPRLVYADWLLSEPRWRQLGEYMVLALGGPAREWRAQLVMELDGDVLGPFAYADTRFRWARGLIQSAAVGAYGVKPLLDHAASCALETLWVRWPSGTPPPLLGEAKLMCLTELTVRPCRATAKLTP